MLTSFLHSEVLGHLAHFSCYRSGYVSCSVQGKVIDFLYLVACVLNPEVIEGAFQTEKLDFSFQCMNVVWAQTEDIYV